MEYPNSITSAKCDPLHLEWMSNIHYKCQYGYFLMKENQNWVFLPFEYEFDTGLLSGIIDVLNNLNESTTNEL